jgi:uncharacterized protein (DUF4213/DUF364 family)
MKDPISILLDDFPYDAGKILASACGDAYVAIMLANGQIGVCSTLNQPVDTDPLTLTMPDLNRMDHRKLVMAFANAHINYMQENLGSGDIFDRVDFSKSKHTVMVGYFPPLVEKFRNGGLPLSVFDQQKDYPDLTPLSQLKENLDQAGSVILTSTSLINSTFLEIIPQINQGPDIYLLGPSTPLYPVIKEQFNVTCLFGMVFKPYDFEILEIISKGLGTQSFSQKSKKVSL